MKILHKLVPSLLLDQCESLVLGSHDVPSWSSNHFLQFCTVKLISFCSSPLVGGNCPKVSEILHETWILHSSYTLLSENSKLNHQALWGYCAFHKHANSKVQKPRLYNSFYAAVNLNYDNKQRTLKHRNTQNGSKSTRITNHKPWPFESVKVKFCFLRGPLRWLTAAKNAIVSWLLNFRIGMFVKSVVMLSVKMSGLFRFLLFYYFHSTRGTTR